MISLIGKRLRRLARRPRLVLPAVGSLALGCGGMIILLALIQGVLLNPLPFPDSDELYFAGWRFQPGQVHPGGHTARMARHLVEDSNSFAAIGRYADAGSGYVLTGPEGSARSVTGMLADQGLLEALGLQPARGRLFGATDISQGAAVALVSTRLADDLGLGQEAVGQSLLVDGTAHEVIGVLSREFWFEPDVDLVLPLREGGIGAHGHNTMVIGRLAAGVSAQAAEAELVSLHATVGEAAGQPLPANPHGTGMAMTSLGDSLLGPAQRPLSLLLSAAGLLMLLACFNVANLVLAEATSARGETAVELALGARPGQLVLQRFSDCVLLTLGGLLGGLLLAWLLLPLVIAAAPVELPRLNQVGIDLRVLVWLLPLGLVASLASTALALLGQHSVNLAETLRGTASGRGGERAPLRRLLVISQVTLSVVLLVLSAMVAASLQRLAATDLGFTTDQVLTAQLSLGDQRYRQDQAIQHTDQFIQSLLTEITAWPGITEVAVASSLPLTRGLNNYVTRPGTDQGASVEVRLVSPAYFDLLDVPTLQGRSLHEGDRAGGAPVMVINEAMARLLLEPGAAVDATLSMDGLAWRVVGVVADQREVNLRIGAQPTAFITYQQAHPGLLAAVNQWFPMALMIRGPQAGAVASDLRQAVQGMAPEVAVERIRPLADLVTAQLVLERFLVILLACFGICALLLSATGLFGLLEFERARRRHEMAVRMALGAEPGRIVAGLTGSGLAWTLAGVGLGGLLALPAVRALEELLHEPGLADLGLVVGAVLASAVLMALATLISALRAAGIRPAEALRQE